MIIYLYVEYMVTYIIYISKFAAILKALIQYYLSKENVIVFRGPGRWDEMGTISYVYTICSYIT